MTLTERLQGAALCLLFAVLCVILGRSVILESRAGSTPPAAKSHVSVMPSVQPGLGGQVSKRQVKAARLSAEETLAAGSDVRLSGADVSTGDMPTNEPKNMPTTDPK